MATLDAPPQSAAKFPTLTSQQIYKARQLIRTGTVPLPDWSAGLFQLLQSADYKLALLMFEQAPPIWAPGQPRPQPPPNYDPNAGIEYGALLYLIEQPLPTWLLNELPQEVREIVAALWLLLQEALEAAGVKTQIEPADMQNLLWTVKTTGIIADDGTYYGLKPYEQLDEGWLWAAVNYLAYWLKDFFRQALQLSTASLWPWIPAPFVTGKANVIPLSPSKSQIKIALFGDWGTGQPAVAGQLLTQVMSNQPDYIVHLGDVYYAGTSDLDILAGGEESRNLLQMLHAANLPKGSCFTLNSNHEMCGGARGYYAALNDPLFSSQNGSSYFALQYGGWMIFALDSAYYATTALFMDGSIQDPGNAQAQFIASVLKQYNVTPEKTIVLTHHNGLEGGWTGTPIVSNVLWNQVMGGSGPFASLNPAYWYWGHVHNGIVYTQQPGLGNTLGRCIGHGAIPFGDARNLKALMPQYVTYYAHTPVPSDPQSKLVLNGFAILTLSQDGTMQEDFYELGNSSPVKLQ